MKNEESIEKLQRGLNMPKPHHNLEVWKRSLNYVTKVYEITAKYPDEEKFGLVSQMRRAAVSVPANIAEGFKRMGIAEKMRFHNIAEASLEELKYFVILSTDLGYLANGQTILERAETVSKMLYGLIQSTKRRK